MAGLTAVVPVAADRVLLTNGASYEDVIAHVEGSAVRIQLSTGSLTLPSSRIARIDRGDSVLGEFESRRARLEADPDRPADDWLQLAAWARRHRYPSGERFAALRAAEVDPDLEGLGEVLARHDYVLDPGRRRFVPRRPAPPPPPIVSVERAEQALQEERRQLAEERRALIDAIGRQTERRAPVEPRSPAALPVVPLIVVPWVAAPPLALPAPPDGGTGTAARPYRGYQRLIGRQPGSFLPIDG